MPALVQGINMMIVPHHRRKVVPRVRGLRAAVQAHKRWLSLASPVEIVKAQPTQSERMVLIQLWHSSLLIIDEEWGGGESRNYFFGSCFLRFPVSPFRLRVLLSSRSFRLPLQLL